jgi:hypothetical protein
MLIKPVCQARTLVKISVFGHFVGDNCRGSETKLRQKARPGIMAPMRYNLVIHQNNKLPDLREAFPDEAAALEESRKLARLLKLDSPPSVLSTTSGKITFKYVDFAGMQIEPIEPPLGVRVPPRQPRWD